MVEALVQFVISPESREKYPLLVADFVARLTRCALDLSAAVAVKAATGKMRPAEKLEVAAIPADIVDPSSMEKPAHSLELCCRLLGGSLHERPSRVLFSSVLRASSASGLEQWPLIPDCHLAQNLIDMSSAVRYRQVAEPADGEGESVPDRFHGKDPARDPEIHDATPPQRLNCHSLAPEPVRDVRR
jgi:hypothetical protein